MLDGVQLVVSGTEVAAQAADLSLELAEAGKLAVQVLLNILCLHLHENKRVLAAIPARILIYKGRVHVLNSAGDHWVGFRFKVVLGESLVVAMYMRVSNQKGRLMMSDFKLRLIL